MKVIYKLLILVISSLFFTECHYSQVQHTVTSIKIDSISENNRDITEVDSIYKDHADLVNYENLALDKIYTDTVVFKEYLHSGDFDRIYVTIKDKDLFLINDSEDSSLNRGDKVVLSWKVDSVWIPEASNNKWLTPIAINKKKIKDGKLFLYKEKYLQPISYYYDDFIKEKYSKEDFDEIYNLVLYYLANSKQPLVLSAIKSQSDSLQIQYSIEEQSREENGVNNTYVVVGLSNYFENRNSILQWLYLKQTNYSYKIIYEYDLPNDKLILFN